MPTYEYHCKNCKKSHEAFQKISETPLKKCPSCGQDALERAVGGAGAFFRFKGSGFYQTDYKKSSHTCSENCSHKSDSNN